MLLDILSHAIKLIYYSFEWDMVLLLNGHFSGTVFLILYVGLYVSKQVYDHQYKAVLDGMETESMMEIHPAQRIEIFRMGNGTDEVLEVHDFKNVRVYDIQVKYFHCDVIDSAHIPAI